MKYMTRYYNELMNLKTIEKFKNWFERFLKTDFYIILIMVAALVNWKLKVISIIFVLGIVMVILIFLFNLNRIKLIPIALFSIISLRLDNVNDYVVPAMIGAIIIVPILVIDLFKRKVAYNNNIFIAMIFMLITMIFSIVNAPNLINPILGILMWIFYTFLFLYIFNIKGKYDELENNRIYIAKSLTYLGIAIFLEIILFYYESNISPIDFFGDKLVKLGWAMTNYVAMIYLIIIPMTCYLYTKKQNNYFLLVVILVEILGLVLMLSRGAYLAILISSIPFLIKFIGDIKDKLAFTKTALYLIIALLIAMLLIAIPTGIVKNFFSVLDERGITLTGRELIYKVGINVFARYPLFGGGIYTSEYYISIATNNVYYHNYIIQTLATIGIFGFGAFIYYLYQLIRESTIKEEYNIYVFFAILNMLIHGLFDTTFYNPLVMVMLSIVLPLMLTRKERKIYV